MRDKVIIYDQTYNPAVTGAIAVNTFADLAVLNAAERAFIIESMYIWPPYNLAGLPADIWDVEVRIDGAAYPASPVRLRIRAMADRNMAVPWDQRYAVKNIPFGKISADALEDTTLKVTPAQRIALRINAGPTAGILATDTPIRIALVGRIAETDEQLRDIYGTTNYDPVPKRLGDSISGKVTPIIHKPLPITIENVKYMSGATGQQVPKIFPYWTWTQNRNVVNPVPEYEFSYRVPQNVDFDYQDFRFDWTRITDEALLIRQLGAIIAAGGGNLFWHSPPYRRPGHLNLFFGWPVDAGFPNYLPGGGAPAVAGAGMFQGPLDLMEIGPMMLAYNNLMELRATANAGTTILARNLEVQLRGTHIGF